MATTITITINKKTKTQIHHRAFPLSFGIGNEVDVGSGNEVDVG
jgi:hypothetical protein